MPEYQVTMRATFGLYPNHKQTQGVETIEADSASKAKQIATNKFRQAAAENGMAEEDYKLEVLDVKKT